MGGKHPAPGHVFIVSQFNGYALATNDEHEIVMSQTKAPRGDEGWRISNVPNDENIQRIGYNYIIHNKHPLKLLGCDENGNITTSERRQWDSLSGWRIVQQKDTNIYHLVNHYDYWLTLNETGDIVMLKQHQLSQNPQQNWYLEYISQQEMKRKVPRIEPKAMEHSQQEAKKNEEIIQNILHRTDPDHINTPGTINKPPLKHIDIEDGYGVDDESDPEHKTDYTPSRKRKKVASFNNIYNKNEMDKKFEALTDTLAKPLRELASSVRLIRSEVQLLKIEMKNMEQRAQMERNQIKETLKALQKDGGCLVRNSREHEDNLSVGRKEVKDWITNTVGFAEYSWNFLDNGFDSLDIVKKVSDPEQLSDIGITLKGHKIQIMAEILQLTFNHN